MPLIARDADASLRKPGFPEMAVATPTLLLALRILPLACTTAAFTAAGDAPAS